MTEINWDELSSPISKHFTVKEMIWLPSWNRAANASDGLNDQIKSNLVLLASKMDLIREFFGKPINVHVTYRPPAYNSLVKGSLHSSHVKGLAMDFDVSGMNCDDIRASILANDLLNEYDLYCENLPQSSWVHLNCYDGIPRSRFFKP